MIVAAHNELISSRNFLFNFLPALDLTSPFITFALCLAPSITQRHAYRKYITTYNNNNNNSDNKEWHSEPKQLRFRCQWVA